MIQPTLNVRRSHSHPSFLAWLVAGENRPATAVIAVLTCAVTIPLAFCRLLPLVDLPFHLAVATVYAHLGEAGNVFAEYFRIDAAFKPNVAHPLFCSLPVFPSVEWANHAYLGLYALLMLLSVILLVKRLGGNLWLGILAVPLVNNFSLMWGFVGFTMAIPLVLLSYYFALGWVDERNKRDSLMLAWLLALLFFVHALACVWALLLFGSLLLYRCRPHVRQWLSRAWVALPVIILLAIWWLFVKADMGPSLIESLGEYYSALYPGSLVNRARELFALDQAFLFRGWTGIAVAATHSLAILVLAVTGLVRSRKVAMSDQEKYFAKRGLLLAGVAIVCFFGLPQMFPGVTFIYHRLAVFFWIGLVLVASVLWKRVTTKPVKIVIILIAVVYTVLWIDYYVEFGADNEEFTAEFLPSSEDGARLGGMIFEADYRGHPVYVHYPNYYIIWKQGIATTTMLDYRFGTVRRATAYRQLPPYHAWIGKSSNYDGRYNELEYLVVRGEVPDWMQSRLGVFYRLDQRGEWSLFGQR